jgi:hypothetical protein
LNEAGAQFQMTTTLSDAIATTAINFGLRLGDKVGIIARGRRYTTPIEVVEFTVTPQRQIMRPRFGAAEPDEFRQLLRSMGRLRSRPSF